MSEEKKYYLGMEAVSRIACILQEAIMLEASAVDYLKNVELVETFNEEDGKNYLVLSEEYFKTLPKEAATAMTAFLNLGEMEQAN